MYKAMLALAVILAGWNSSAPEAWAQVTAKKTNQLSPADIVVSTKRPPETRNDVGIVRYGITRDDFDRITQSFPTIQTAVPVRAATHEARYGEHATKVRVVGSTAELANSYPLDLARGRFLTCKDVNSLNNVAVLSAETAERLFQDKSPLGKNVRIERHYFIIVGVTQPRQRPARGRQPLANPEVYVPITTMRARFGDQVITREKGAFQGEAYELSEIRITITRGDDVSSAAQVISRLLQETHESNDYSIEVSARRAR